MPGMIVIVIVRFRHVGALRLNPRRNSTRKPPSLPERSRASALHVEQFDVEDQGRVRRYDAAGAARAITELRRNDQSALAADFHRGDTFVPARNHLALSDRKLERIVAIDRGVELLALLAILVEPAGVMHDANLAGLWRGAGAYLGVDDLQS